MVTRQLITDRHFDLDAILDGTQDFRWRRWRDHWHSGVLSGNVIHIRQINRGVEYRAHSDLDALLRSYFRLEDDIDAIHADIACRDDKVATPSEEVSVSACPAASRPLGMYDFLHLFGQQQRGPYQQDCGKDSRGVGAAGKSR